MRVPYYTKTSLSRYYALIKSGRWEIPDYSDKCLICLAKDCAKYHGAYTRGANSPEENFSAHDLPCPRFLCHGKGVAKKTDHKTFSLLPYQLMPFRKLAIKYIILAVFIKIKKGLSGFKALDKIESLFPNPNDIAEFLNQCALYQWEVLVRDAFERFIKSHFYKSHPRRKLIKSEDPRDRIIGFLKLAMKHESQYLNAPKRGPDEMAFDFYLSNDGSGQLAPFLFGVASQHRK